MSRPGFRQSEQSVAIADMDGDQLPNDVCYVDTRTDQVIVAPLPGTGDRFAPFALDRRAPLVRPHHDVPRRTACPATSTKMG